MGLNRTQPASDDRQVAIALGYDRSVDRAPKILGRGRGSTAQEILDLAREHGITIREDGDLAALLERIPLFDEIVLGLLSVMLGMLRKKTRSENQS